MHERQPKKALLKKGPLARATRHGFAGANWQMVTMPSSSACSKTANGLADHAGRLFMTTECNDLSCFMAELNAVAIKPHR
jgi:hypothetical protein